jgi:D-ribose pyranose/furanose isomerase RbsD
MSATVKVVTHSREIEDLLKSEDIRAELHRRGEPVLAAAQESAPVASGAYKASLFLADDTTDRAVVRVGATVPYAMVVEARTGNLVRALDAGGGV